MFGNKAAGAGSACCPGAPRPEASGTRAAGPGWAGGAGLGFGRAGEGLAGRGAQTAASSSLGPRGGWACGAPVRLARGVVADPEAHPGVAPPRGPANPWRPRGERAGGRAGVLAAWGAGGPSAGEKGDLGRRGSKVTRGQAAGGRDAFLHSLLRRRYFLLLFFCAFFF